MTQSVARPSNLGALWAEIFTEALVLATAFFVYYLKFFRAKHVSTARNRWRKENFSAESIPLVSSCTGY